MLGNDVTVPASIVGITAHAGESAAALVVGDEVVAAIAEETLSGVPGDTSLPRLAIRACLEIAGLAGADVDAVVYAGDPVAGFTRDLVSTLAGFPRSRKTFVDRMKHWLGTGLHVGSEIATLLDVDPSRVRCIPRNVCGTSQAFFSSPFDEAAVLVIDDGGEWVSTTIALAARRKETPIRILETSASPHLLAGVTAESASREEERALLDLATHVRRKTGSAHLCLVGPPARNPALVRRLAVESGFSSIFIPPEPGKKGAAVGAAFEEYRRRSRDIRPLRWDAWTGLPADADRVASLLAAERGERRAVVGGTPVIAARHADLDSLVGSVVDDLAAGHLVGWCRGRAEFGQRPLGNRAILANPSNAKALLRCPGKRGMRRWGLAVAAEEAPLLFEPADAASGPARQMQADVRLRPGLAARFTEVAGPDGTVPSRICASGEQTDLHRLLKRFGGVSGHAALAMTTLNEPGYPLAATPIEAFATFFRTRLDALVVDDIIIRREA